MIIKIRGKFYEMCENKRGNIAKRRHGQTLNSWFNLTLDMTPKRSFLN